MKKIKIGVIGCGRHAKHHADHWSEWFETYAAWDKFPMVAAAFESATKPESLLMLLEDPNVEAVFIGSPDDAHLSQIEMALAAGKHVMCEKPLCAHESDIAKLEQAFRMAKSKKLVLTSCHPRRFDRPFEWLRKEMPRRFKRDFVTHNRFGKPIGILFDFSYHKPSNAWKHTRSLLLDHLNHEVDLMNFLFGISGFEAWKLDDGPDRYRVVGKRFDEISFDFHGTRRLNEDRYPEWCRIRFDAGEIEMDMQSGVARVADHDKGTTEIVPNLSIDYEGRLKGVMKDFAQQIGGQRLPRSLTRPQMLMNTEAGIILQKDGLQCVNVRW